jgi:hypothetical protein
MSVWVSRSPAMLFHSCVCTSKDNKSLVQNGFSNAAPGLCSSRGSKQITNATASNTYDLKPPPVCSFTEAVASCHLVAPPTIAFEMSLLPAVLQKIDAPLLEPFLRLLFSKHHFANASSRHCAIQPNTKTNNLSNRSPVKAHSLKPEAGLVEKQRRGQRSSSGRWPSPIH